MSTASQGRAREHRVRDALEAAGWHFIVRSAGSKGPADLIHAHPDHGVILVQVGTSNKRLGPADRARFIRAAELCRAVPVVAIQTPRKPIEYRRCGPTPFSGWEPWSP